LCSFLHLPPLHSSSIQILSLSPCSHLSLCSSYNVTDHVSRPYGTTGKIIALYILTFIFFDSRREDRRSRTEC
jgi:hypothetical protein